MEARTDPRTGVTKTKPMNEAVTVLIASCDQYSDAWELFFKLFWKHWPDCQYLMCLGANSLSVSDARVRSILVGKDKDWSSNLLLMLQEIATPYVFLCLEDYF